jgi:isoquinoline 1-oxidoreductase
MVMTRRTFVELAGGGFAYAFTLSYGCGRGLKPFPTPMPTDHAARYFVDYTEWLFIHPDGTVTAHTGRTELGQGLTTVLNNVIAQGLELPANKVRAVMGDTANCPDDGPTEGSNSTRIVVWGHWRACELIRADLIVRAAAVLELPVRRLIYRDGGVEDQKRPERRVEIGALGDGMVRVGGIDPQARSTVGRPIVKHYVDRGTPSVHAEAIVTGTLKYTADLFPGECDYGAMLLPEYYRHLSSVTVDLESARAAEGVLAAHASGRNAFVVGKSYTAVRRGLTALDARWKSPGRPHELDNEGEIRAGAALEKVVEERGDPETALARADRVVTESYVTQYASQAPIETETAIARVEDGSVTIWAATQAPFKIPPRTARRLGIPEESVRVISMPVGGGFGVKVDTPAPTEAAAMAWQSGRTVKHVYSRAHQFIGRGRFKESTVIDITSVVTSSGRLVARTIDLYQDEGFGTTETYDVRNVRTRLFKTEMPPRHGTMRGTSYVQSGFAVESHTDMVAEMVAMDPVKFRKKNVALRAFRPLLDACAEMIGYGQRELPERRGIGFGICHHGGRQLGAVAAEVSVDIATGRIRLERMVGAFDIGLVINRNTLTANTVGAMIWGLGYALFEEVDLNGHTVFTRSFDDYRIPRFSDIPPIEVIYLDNLPDRSGPRGCGELPVIPSVAAICNAVYRATGVRFHTLPMTPQRVFEALRSGTA